MPPDLPRCIQPAALYHPEKRPKSPGPRGKFFTQFIWGNEQETIASCKGVSVTKFDTRLTDTQQELFTFFEGPLQGRAGGSPGDQQSFVRHEMAIESP